jgi:hypothetical protein
VTTLRVRPQADRDTDQAAEFYAREAGIDVALLKPGSHFRSDGEALHRLAGGAAGASVL